VTKKGVLVKISGLMEAKQRRWSADGKEPVMEVLLESEEQMGQNKQKRRGKRQRPDGPPAPSPAAIAGQTGRLLAEREREWLERLTTDPASFASVELEVHEQARRQADLYVAGLLAKASERAETATHIDKVINAAEVPLRPVEKKDAPWWCGFSEDWRSR
jgi:hypothetical protein